jgi:hypothetical protein
LLQRLGAAGARGSDQGARERLEILRADRPAEERLDRGDHAGERGARAGEERAAEGAAVSGACASTQAKLPLPRPAEHSPAGLGVRPAEMSDERFRVSREPGRD